MSQHEQKVLRDLMAPIPVTVENGVAFYEYLFTVAPDLRKYFKGSESIEPNQVAGNDRFQKQVYITTSRHFNHTLQGLRIILAIHTCIETMCNDMVLRAYAREVVNKHRMFKMDYGLYEAFFAVTKGYIEKMLGKPLSGDQTSAWDGMGKQFCKHVKEYLAEQGKE